MRPLLPLAGPSAPGLLTVALLVIPAPSTAQTSRSADTQRADSGVAYVVRGVPNDHLGLKERPMAASPFVVRDVRNGDRLRGLGCSPHEGDVWCRVEYAGSTGWVRARWLEERDADEVPPPPRREIYCESQGDAEHVCALPGMDPVSVRLERQVSAAACERGRTWGVREEALWVDEGCRAVFSWTVTGGGQAVPTGGA